MLALLAAAFLMAFSLWVWVQYWRPALELRRSLHGLAQGQPVPDASLAQPPGLDGIAMDLSEINARLREMDRQIADEGFSLRAILAGMVEGVVILDRQETIRLANDAIVRMFDFKRSPMNKSVLEVFQSPQLKEAVGDTMETAHPKKLTITFQSLRDGKPVPRFFEVSVVALDPEDSGSPAGVIAVFHDISELKNLESVRRELVANVSHELRTPLSIINGYIETLLEGAIEEPELSRKFLLTMRKHGDRLNLLIEDLFTISKLESRTADLDFQEISLTRVAESVIERLEKEITERKAVVEVVASPDLPDVEADSHRMDQVFFNLIENALKYCGGNDVHVRIELRAEGSSWVEARVTDNGPGIPFDDQPQIFERFYRVFKDRSRDAGGTGLGLSIVKHVILAHGGEIGLESQPGKGATFWFRLPCEQSDTHL